MSPRLRGGWLLFTTTALIIITAMIHSHGMVADSYTPEQVSFLNSLHSSYAVSSKDSWKGWTNYRNPCDRPGISCSTSASSSSMIQSEEEIISISINQKLKGDLNRPFDLLNLTSNWTTQKDSSRQEKGLFPYLKNFTLFNRDWRNGFSGYLPSSLRLWYTFPNLEVLEIRGLSQSSSGNRLNKSLSNLNDDWGNPSASYLRKMASLKNISLPALGVSGTFPLWWILERSDSPSSSLGLEHLDLRSNNLNGSLPSTVVVPNRDIPPPSSSSSSSSNEDSMSSSSSSSSSLEEPQPPTCCSVVTLLLSHNRFYGDLPSWMMTMSSGGKKGATSKSSRLRHVSLASNNFTGTLPPAGPMESLKYIDLAANNLEGLLPQSWVCGADGPLSTIPASGGREKLDISGNKLTGTLPTCTSRRDSDVADREATSSGGEIGELSSTLNIKVLALGYNSFKGTIPLDWTTSNNSSVIPLSYLDLEGNKLTRLPLELPPNLRFFRIRNNLVEGTISRRWESSPLQQIYLDRNQDLHGSLPNWCDGSNTDDDQTIITTTNLNSANLLCHSLVVFSASNNHLSGSIPNSWWINISWGGGQEEEEDSGGRVLPGNNGAADLQWAGDGEASQGSTLRLDYNKISGSLPTSSSDLLSGLEEQVERVGGQGGRGRNCTLARIFLSGNRIDGTLPANWTRGTDGRGTFSSSVPLGFPYLKVLHLNDNLLHGSVPEEWGAQLIAREGAMDHSATSWSGSSFHHYFPTRFEDLFLSGNNITGTLPRSWSPKSSSWMRLELSRNKIEGTLPAEWFPLSFTGRSTGTYGQLTLASNRLSGSIPEGLFGRYGLSWVDLSGNERLNGTVTSQNFQEVLQGFVVYSTAGSTVFTEKPASAFSTLGTTSSIFVDVTSSDNKNPPLRGADRLPLQLSLTSPFAARDMRNDVTALCDKSWFSGEETFLCNFGTTPVPHISRRPPVFGIDRFLLPVTIYFNHQPFAGWQSVLLSRAFTIDTTPSLRSMLQQGLGRTEHFLKNRYIYKYQVEVFAVVRSVKKKRVSSASSSTATDNGLVLEEDGLGWVPLNDTDSLMERSQNTRPFRLGGPLLSGFLDPTLNWKNISLRHGLDYVLRIEIILEDQWAQYATSSSSGDPPSSEASSNSENVGQRPVNVPGNFGTTHFVLTTDPFQRAPCPGGGGSGLLAVENTTECVGCPEGLECNGTTILRTANPPRWRPTKDLLPAIVCPAESGGCLLNSSGAICREHYTGPFCSKCEPGYGEWIGHCYECPPLGVSILLVLLMSFASLGYISWVVTRSIRETVNIRPTFPLLSALSVKSAVPLKIVMNHLSLMGLVSATVVATSSVRQSQVSSALSLQYVFGNLAIYDVLAVSCLSSAIDAKYKFLLALLLFFVVLLIQLILVKLRSSVPRFRKHTLFQTFSSPGDRSKRRYLPWLSALLCMLRLLHPTLITYSASLIPCQTFDFFHLQTWTLHRKGDLLPPPTESLSLLVRDWGVSCDEQYRRTWKMVGWGSLLGFGVVIPAVCVLIMKQTLKHCGYSDMSKLFAFLARNFRPEKWYWESVLMMRELVGFTILSVILEADLQLVALNTMLVVWLCLHARSEPFLTTALNKTEYFSVGAAFITLNLLAVLAVFNRSEDNARADGRADLEAEAATTKFYVSLAIMGVQLTSLLAICGSAGMFLFQDVKKHFEKHGGIAGLYKGRTGEEDEAAVIMDELSGGLRPDDNDEEHQVPVSGGKQVKPRSSSVSTITTETAESINQFVSRPEHGDGVDDGLPATAMDSCSSRERIVGTV